MKFANLVARIQLSIAMTSLIIMGAVTVADVALKYMFNRPIAGAYDLVESLLPVVVFNGLPAMLLRRQTIVIDLVDHFASPRVVRILGAVADIVVLAMFSAMTIAFIAPARLAFDYGDRKIELGLPIGVIWAVVIAGMAGVVLAAAVNFIAALRQSESARS